MSKTLSYNSLKREGINRLNELVQKTEEDLSNIRNMGRKSLNEIIEKLEGLGMSLTPINQLH
ncbi:DNA-directed RNA polymerase subunit alpha C-terminal domain-containing protein [Paenibacillus sp. LjRoot153]|uniref:DNA-directed RNA polymerase subunit alpha C-terminal domain-containing protein n=1 Tax=Paenibacillus sp. LjRoot153 TaxID=3342270 RepID=UPI003F503F8C